MVLLAITFTATAFADRDDNFAQMRAERLFDSMSADEAMNSNKFTKRIWNINLPGTSTWFKPTGLCLTNDKIQTTREIKICTEWSVDLKDREFGRDTAVFDTYGAASRKADSSNARGNAYCSDSFSSIISGDRTRVLQKCVLWGVKMENSARIKEFRSRVRAEDYADNSSKARGDAFCINKGLVKSTAPTTFRVDFYRKTSGDRYADKKYLGRHVYPIQMCN